MADSRGHGGAHIRKDPLSSDDHAGALEAEGEVANEPEAAHEAAIATDSATAAATDTTTANGPEAGSSVVPLGAQTAKTKKGASTAGTGKGKRKKKRSWDTKSKVLLGIGVVLLAAALIIGGMIVYGYMDARARYDTAREASGIDTDVLADITAGNRSLIDIDIDWDELRAVDPDVVGWIYIENTDINYPIVQGDDNEYYLYHAADGSSSSSGAIFLDADCSADFSDDNNIIYGHNMLDGSMFAQILRFKDQDFLNQECKIIIATPQYAFMLAPAFTYVCDGAEKLRQIEFSTDADLQAYISELMDHAVTESLVDVTQIDKLFSLVTCSYEANDVRTVLCCVQAEAVTFTQ